MSKDTHVDFHVYFSKDIYDTSIDIGKIEFFIRSYDLAYIKKIEQAIQKKNPRQLTILRRLEN